MLTYSLRTQKNLPQYLLVRCRGISLRFVQAQSSYKYRVRYVARIVKISPNQDSYYNIFRSYCFVPLYRELVRGKDLSRLHVSPYILWLVPWNSQFVLEWKSQIPPKRLYQWNFANIQPHIPLFFFRLQLGFDVRDRLFDIVEVNSFLVSLFYPFNYVILTWQPDVEAGDHIPVDRLYAWKLTYLTFTVVIFVGTLIVPA